MIIDGRIFYASDAAYLICMEIRKEYAMKNNDYGYFGKGPEGYVHYMQAVNEAQKSGGGGRRPPRNSGCLTAITGVIAAVLFIALLL